MSKKPKLTKEEKRAKREAERAAMTPEQIEFEKFNNRWHNIGRIWNTIGILLILAVPVVICLYFKVSPNWAVFGDAGVITLLLINWGAGIGEPVIYAPMLGTNGEYLAFITGNLSNLKIPCVVKAHEIAETEIGTRENEIVSTISVAVSSLVTVLIIAIMVVCLAVSPLQQSIENAPYLTPAFGCVVYALFGSLGGKYLVKNPKMGLVCGFILAGLSALISGVTHGKTSIGSASLAIGIIMCALFAFIEIMRNKKKAKAIEAQAQNNAPVTIDIDATVDEDGNVEIEEVTMNEDSENK